MVERPGDPRWAFKVPAIVDVPPEMMLTSAVAVIGWYRLTVFPAFTLNCENWLKATPPRMFEVVTSLVVPPMATVVSGVAATTWACAGRGTAPATSANIDTDPTAFRNTGKTRAMWGAL